MRIDIHEDIRRAQTLPARCYVGEDWHARFRECVFRRCWHFAGDARFEGARPLRVDAEPLLLTRAPGGEPQCVSNVCTHRGNLLATEECEAKELRCRYHGRRFALDGRFLSMPEFDDAVDFPSDRDDLPRLPCETLGPFAFVSLDPTIPFGELTEDVAARHGGLDAMRLHGTKDYEVKANWALYVDNYLEGFHIPFVHAGLHAELDFGKYRTDLFRYAVLQTGVGPDGEEAAHYWWLFPNLMLNFYPWGLSVNVVEPLAVDRTRVRFLTYVSDASRLGEGAGADLDTVEREDEEVVEAVQEGVRGRLYDRGRYSPTQERGVHRFHRLLAEFAG